MLRTLGLIVIAVIVGILAYAAGQPDSFRVERRVSIAAPPAAIYPLLSDFRGWRQWSPWENKDPAMTRSYSGPGSGVGAAYEWSGNSEVGSGRMEISQAIEPVKVTIDLHFTAPFEANNTAEFVLTPEGEQTAVSWVMSGPSPYVSKLMGLFVSMDEMIGGDFEIGLAKLKATVEGSTPAA